MSHARPKNFGFRISNFEFCGAGKLVRRLGVCGPRLGELGIRNQEFGMPPALWQSSQFSILRFELGRRQRELKVRPDLSTETGRLF